MNTIKLFKSQKPIIGVIHLMPSPGFEGHQGIDAAINASLKDLEALKKGGVDAVIVENNYDLPHKIEVEAETIAYMTYLTSVIVNKTNLPIGISVLWNDYKAAFAIAKVTSAQFIRIPAYVDDVQTSFGKVYAVAKEAKKFQKKINADNIFIFADIQVKHSKMLHKSKTLKKSINQAVKNGADALIITGKWTGDAPDIGKLKEAKKAAKNFPIVIGSGVCEENIHELRPYVNGFIVSTSLKEGKTINKNLNRNLTTKDQRISTEKVKLLVAANK